MLVAVAVFLPVRFGWLPRSGALDLVVDVVGIIGAGIVIGLMAFGFFGARVGIALGAVFAVGVAPFAIGVISQYPALSGSLAGFYSADTEAAYFGTLGAITIGIGVITLALSRTITRGMRGIR